MTEQTIWLLADLVICNFTQWRKNNLERTSKSRTIMSDTLSPILWDSNDITFQQSDTNLWNTGLYMQETLLT